MDLFNSNPLSNLLPFDGKVNYYGRIMSKEKADAYLELLLNKIEWKNDEAVIFGKHIITARKVAWYADTEYSYTYSGTTKKSLLWTKELLELKQLVEEISGDRFNACLMNLYHTGEEGMAFHSDDEKALEKHSPVASLSFGAERKFSFKHKRTKETVSLILEHGSLLLMRGETQTNWMHRLPPTTKVKRLRISLTFRRMIE